MPGPDTQFRDKILIVDDEESVVRVLQMYLENEGYETLAAYDWAQAVQYLRREHPVLMLLDIVLPDRHGLTLMEEIKRIDPRVAVIVMTGLGGEVVGRRAIRGGAVQFIHKPLDFRHLGRLVEEQLRLRA